jgi:hypothetical protein
MAKKPIKSVNLLPEFLRTDKNSKFLSSTIDQLIQPPKLERLNGFIGSKLTPTYISTSDVYISETLPLRRNYQLEPALVIKDQLAKVKQVKAIDDLANEIMVEGGFDNDFDRLFRSNFYSFNPRIDFDKFVNYQKYYWLSTGPQTITVTGKQLNSTSTYTVSDNEIDSAWIFTPDGLTEDPLIVLYRGNTYNFVVNSEYPFYIKTAPTLGLTDVYNINVTGNGSKNGVVSINITDSTPTTLYYTSDEVNFVQGKIIIKQVTEDSFIDVENEILGKKNYTSGSGLDLSNGMKIKFGGEVIPESYKDKEYFVEGVGAEIRLIEYSLLTGSEKLASQFDDDFDVYGFDNYPFDNFQQLPIVPEYLTINRASRDLNPWSRYNRWVHEDIIKISAEFNGFTAVLPANTRARRPIIEFSPDLQLFNFGNRGVRNIDLIDNETLDAFSKVEGSAGYYVDGVLLEQGHRVVFNADTDDLVRGRIYEVNYNILGDRLRLELIPAEDNIPQVGYSLATTLGSTTAGKSWWFNGDAWQLAQQHETLNQPPLFELFDSEGISYSSSVYKSNFIGNKVFSYEIGTGTPDPVLGFPLSYKNTKGIGSFKFKNFFTTEIISIFNNNEIIEVPTSQTYLKINKENREEFINVWTLAEPYEIPILQLYSTIEPTSTIELNAIDNPDQVQFRLEVYINGSKLSEEYWYTNTAPAKVYINFYNPVEEGKNILLKIFTRALANNNGQYEIPVGLTNNPLNGPIEFMTLTEISDHFKTMTERSLDFQGSAFGNNNARDILDIAKYGYRLISNINPISFANFFLGIKEYDVIDSIQQSADQYNQFKLSLIKKINEVTQQINPSDELDNIMTALNADKEISNSWSLSDMIAYGSDKTTRLWTITDLRNTIYPIANDFNPSKLSLRAIYVYLNGRQLILEKDYRFLVNDSSIELLTDFTVGDELKVDDYFSTAGCYIPATPTKLGLYPKFVPEIYLDNTYTVPTKVIQGHDGSITVAYNDFRDNIILEFENRVFNNIKSQYRPELLDINSIMPGVFRSTDYSKQEVDTVLRQDFVKWTNTFNVDYLTNSTFDFDNSFTWNYIGGSNTAINVPVSGYWRSFFRDFYDTDRPHTHPWEMLGFSEKPNWWEDEYGPAPYTSGNHILWEDLEQGYIRQGPRQGIDILYSRTDLSKIIPVDQFGNLIDPGQGFISNTTPYSIRQNWVFGDSGPAETAWRRSSYWPFAVQRLLALLKPSDYTSLCYDVSRMEKNIAGQWTYGANYRFLNLSEISISGDHNSLNSGYSVMLTEIGLQRTSQFINQLKDDLTYVDFNLFNKVGGFVSKDKLQIVIDAIEPNSISPGSLLPQENYQLVLNTSNPIKSARISGIIIQKVNDKFVLKGYDRANPYFTVMVPKRLATTPTITIGGVTESFLVWSSGESGGETGLSNAETTTASSPIAGIFYQQGQIVQYNQKFYRVKVSHRAGSVFNFELFQEISSLPIIGGVSVQLANGFRPSPIDIAYGTEFERIQNVYDIIIGYGEWLKSEGFIFDEYNQNLNELLDWNLSAKEFLYWTTQNWAENSIITLSPFASKLKYTLPDSVVDNIFDSFYQYSILKEDGLPLPEKAINVNRQDGICILETVGTTDGIYFAELNSVQKEHAMVFDNTTVFNDIIYDIETGYRQRRMKLIGFRTSEWNGDYFSPGFVYDDVEISDWRKYTTYIYGDTVIYNGNYYSAKTNIAASTEFNFNDWVLLKEKPIPELIPNFEYKINQFEDFYSLDIDNFDAAQQKMAQHLTGYTPRVYLNNIFINPISQYKFYQGFIKEKGTRNAIQKIAKASLFNFQGETDFTEEWAFRVGQYGSYSSYQEIEIPLKEGSFIENPQIINFVDSKPTNPIDLIYYNTLTDIVITPEDYTPSQTFITSSTNNFKLPIAGYISFEDITATAYNENSLLDIANEEEINNGDVIWLGFKANGDWDVLRYELSEAKLIGVFVSSPGIDITFVTDLFHNLSVGDIISITRFNDQVNGVYFVKNIPKLNQITVSSNLPSITNDELLSPGLLYKFTGVRATTYDNLPNNYQMLRSPYGSKFWIDNQDNNGTFNWQVYQKIDNYDVEKINPVYSVPDQELGFSINKKPNSDVLLVGSPGYFTILDYGRVFVYKKTDQTSNLLFSYTLNDSIDQIHASTGTTELGHSVAYSSNIFAGTDYGLLYAGAPGVGDLLSTGTNIRRAVSTGILLPSVQAGAVKISSVDPVTTNEVTELVLLSPNYSDYERFGKSVVVYGSANNLFVGAPGTATTGSGKFYIYQTLAPNASLTAISTASSSTNVIFINSTASITVGQTVWVSGILNDILNGVKVQTIYDDGLSQYITLDTDLPQDIPADTKIKFYTTSSLITSNGIYTTTNGLLISYITEVGPLTVNTGSEFGHAIAISDTGLIGVISAPGGDFVETFINSGTGITRAAYPSVFGNNVRFGEAVSMSIGGDYMFVGAPNVKNNDDSFGKVAIYKKVGNAFTYTGFISNPLPGAAMNFGTAINIDSNTATLAISAIGINKFVPVKFDEDVTTFDSNSTNFFDVVENFGTVYLFQREKNLERFVLVDEITPEIEVGTDIKGTNFGFSLLMDLDVVYVGAPATSAVTTSSFYQFTKIDSSKNSLEIYKSYSDLVDIDTIQRVRLVNTFEETIVDYLDIIDPVKGKISGLAEQELKFKSAYDPAIYSIGTAGVVVDADTSWLDEHIGDLWWDLSTVKYVWYEQGNLTYRKNNWGNIFPGATIDVYEWVRSSYLPNEWSAIADTSAGLTEGISGQPKYVDNSAISIKQIYNSVSNSFSNIYYYWVKNKVTIPNVRNRRISSYQVASIIADPNSYGLKYAAILSNDAVALANVGPILVDDRIHLNIGYDNIKNNISKHTEWILLEEGSANSQPPVLYEKKLFDSLLGRDSLGNLVPDPSLTARTRYGIDIRPRQAIFKDRRSALRELIEFSNSILLENQITGSYSFRNLNTQETPPDESSNQYDQTVEDNEGLLLIDTRLLERAELSCTVLNGKIRNVSIIKSGLGYRIPPNVTILNNQNSAIITTEIDSAGRVVSANIVDAGSGFSEAPNLVVRPYTVIVLADNLYNGKWTKFEWTKTTNSWERKQTQKYNTPLYWVYVDWKSSSYNEFNNFIYTVDQVYQLDTLEEIIPGQYVKVKNIGDGRYAILEKADEGDRGNFGKGYNIVYSQNGTIQFLDLLWNIKQSNLNYDQNNTYDQTLYDQTPDLELGYILTALKEDIFINELKINWNLFFFKAVKYALTEQKLLDWAFKTSFINVINFAGQLDQRPVYNLQSSKNYEDYIKEVKPYHTQIRTFTANHGIFEPSNSYFTDFDLPSYYNETNNSFETVSLGDNLLNQTPWKDWANNYLYSVGEIIIGSGGSGYTYPPQITVETQIGDTGGGATARAYISSGQVSRIEILNSGSGYSRAPKIILTGGGDTSLVPAVVYAQLSNGKVRNNKIQIKFDRIDPTGSSVNRAVVDTFICDGATGEFVLNWFAEVEKTKITVTLDGEIVLGSDYRIENYKSLYNNYSKDYTKIVFLDVVPSYGQILRVDYFKNIELLSASERIFEFYQSSRGNPGKELPQLMTGMEYPGVSLQGLPFDYTTNWDISYNPFGKGSYADNINYYTNAEVTAPALAGTDTLFLSTTTGIAVGQIVNIISADKAQTTSSIFAIYENNLLKDVKVISVNTSSRSVKVSSTLSQSLIGTSTYFYVDGVITTVTNTATIEFWFYDSNFSILDSSYSAGSWNTLTNALSGALGINPEDIIIDGDSFITPNTSYGPEEYIPGETHDSLGINVYTRYNKGAPVVYNGSVDVYPFTITTATLSYEPPSLANIFVTFNNKIFSYTNNSSHLSTVNASEFSINWAENKIIIGPQATQGKLGYTIVSIGGGRSGVEPGIIDRSFAVVEDGDTQAELVALSTTGTVKSAYVTVNGVSIPKLTNPNSLDLGYMIIESNTTPRRAAVRVYNLSSAGTKAIQAWFFGTENKFFNEFYEQIFNVGFEIQDSFELTQPPGNIEPAAANIIVEMNTGNGFRRLQPPFISYYRADPAILTYKIDNNIQRTTADFVTSGVRVYINGVQLFFGLDFYVDEATQTVVFRNGVLNNNDVIAILGIPSSGYPLSEFDIQGNILSLLNPQSNITLRVITFTNHDEMSVRTESFLGSLNRRFKVSRSIVNNNFIWVSVNGITLINKLDYTVLEDARTVELSDKWHTTSSDQVVITTLSSDQLAETVLGYRIFNDIFGRSHYKRLSKRNSTVLTQPLDFTDNEIHVADAGSLTPPLISKKIPGVVLINGERIEFWKVQGNTLTQLRRATLGTSPSYSLPIGTKVIDQSPQQTVPFTDRILKQVVYTSATNLVYEISQTPFVSFSTGTNLAGEIVYYNTQTSDGINLMLGIPVIDQVSVTYGGRPLRKAGIYIQDITLSYDSPNINYKEILPVSSVELLPITDTIGTSYLVTTTNQVWVYTNSLETDAVNGYVYRGLKYVEPEFTIINDYFGSYTYDDWATEYSLSNSEKELGIEIANTYYLPNTNFGIINGLRRYGLYRRPDASGLKFWVDYTNTYFGGDTSLLISVFFPATEASSDFSRSLTAEKSFDSGTGVGNFYDKFKINNTVTNRIVLNINDIQDNIKLVITKKEFAKADIWNDQISENQTKSLIYSTTPQAKFLQDRLSELPNKYYYYGGGSTIQLNSGLALTDENDEPLEGI